MEFNGAGIKKIYLGDRPVNKVRQTIGGTDTLIWETTDAPEILLSNPRVIYANAGGYQYLSARGYSNGSGEYANDYAYVVADVVYSYHGNTFKFLEGVQVDVSSISETDTWLSIGHTGYAIAGSDRRAVAVAAYRGTSVGPARTGYITGISVTAIIDGVSRLLTSTVNLAVTQQANTRSEGAKTTEFERVSFLDANGIFCITTTDFTEDRKCPASGCGEDDLYAVVSAQAWVIRTVRQSYSYTSGATSSVDTQTRTAVSADRFRFFLTRKSGGNPYDDASLYQGPTSTEEGGWIYDDGTTYGNNQRLVSFNNMGTDIYADGRYVEVYVEALDEDGGIYRLADNENNVITLYQAANVVTSTTYRNPVGTITLGNWEMSGTDTAVAEGEEEPADTAILEAYITVTRRTTYSSGEYVDTPGIATSFNDGSLRIVIPWAYDWITQSANGIEPDHWRNIHVYTNSATTARTAYPSVFIHFAGQTDEIVGTFAIKQAAYDDGGGDGPEPED